MSDSHHEPVFVQGEARYRDARRVTLVGALVNIVLSIVKIFAGLLGSSHALIADGIHSLSDLATDVVVLVASKHGAKDADEEHPYGHGRIETLATVVLGIILILVAFGIGYDLRTRRMGGNAFVDVDVLVDPALTVSEGRRIGEEVLKRLNEDIDEVTDVTVHIDPEEDEIETPSRDAPMRGVMLERLHACCWSTHLTRPF